MEIENYKSSVKSLAKLGSLGDELGSKSTMKEKGVVLAMSIIPLVASLAKIDFSKLKEEIKGASEEQKKEVNEMFDKEFTLHNAELEQALEDVVDLGSSVKAVVSQGMAVWGHFKALKKKSVNG